MSENFSAIIGVIVVIFIIWSWISNSSKEDKDYEKTNFYNTNYSNTIEKEEAKEIYISFPTFMDENCQKKYPGTKYNKNNDKCECPNSKDFNENINSCPTPKYENIIGKNLEFDYCDNSGFILPANAHCTPFDGSVRWSCNEGFFQSFGEGEYSGQIVCVNSHTYKYYGLLTCEKELYTYEDENGEIKITYECKPNSKRALKNNYEKLNI